MSRAPVARLARKARNEAPAPAPPAAAPVSMPAPMAPAAAAPHQTFVTEAVTRSVSFPPPEVAPQAPPPAPQPTGILARKPALSAAPQSIQRVSGGDLGSSFGGGGASAGGGGGASDEMYDAILRRLRDELEQQGLLGPQSY
jgi:hypothetical protein